MSIAKKVSEIEILFETLDNEIGLFQAKTQLTCLSGCGNCCTNSEIDASPLEFLPWAYQLFLDGKAFELLETLNKSSAKICHNYTPVGSLAKGKGRCGSYKVRGLICRLFGYAANTDKYGKLRLATCRMIKEDQPLIFQNAQQRIDQGLSIPVFTHYYMRLSQIDHHLGETIVPINTALKMALEEVLQYYSYHSLTDDIKGVA